MFAEALNRADCSVGFQRGFSRRFRTVSLIHKRDELHDRADELLLALAPMHTRLVVSDWVLAEFLSGASARSLRARSVEFVDVLFKSPNVTVIPASHHAFLDALAFYRSRPDKEWSLIDCSSMLIYKSRGIRRIFTNDRHFAQAGFDALLR